MVNSLAPAINEGMHFALLRCASTTRSDYPHDVVEIECDKCGRHGRHRPQGTAGHGARYQSQTCCRRLRMVGQHGRWLPGSIGGVVG
jgi:hypothetical protein